MKKILLIEDETNIALVLKAYLEREGYDFVWDKGEGATMEAVRTQKPDLCLLDLTLPARDGLELLEEIRLGGSCPVIILTARGAQADKVKGLRRGADDYIPKPFDPEEVMARIEAVLRRDLGMSTHETVCFGSLLIDFSSASISLSGQTVELIPRDFRVLEFLARNPNRCFQRETLLDRVWGMDYEGSDRAVDTAVKRLRQSLEAWPSSEGEIQTVRGTGYRLAVK